MLKESDYEVVNAITVKMTEWLWVGIREAEMIHEETISRKRIPIDTASCYDLHQLLCTSHQG